MLYNTNTFNNNEQEFDENGRPINTLNQINQTTNSLDFDDEFDENGRPINTLNQINQTTNASDFDDEFDENGRPITKCNNEIENKENLITYDTEEDNDTDENVKILFAKLDKNNKFLTSTEEWALDNDDNNYGAFFIKDIGDNVLDMNIILENESGKEIWTSEIRTIPSNTFVINKLDTNNMYMSKKVLRASDLPSGDDTYHFFIDEKCFSAFCLDVIDNRNIKKNLDEPFDINEVIQTNCEDSKKETSEDSVKDNNLFKIFIDAYTKTALKNTNNSTYDTDTEECNNEDLNNLNDKDTTSLENIEINSPENIEVNSNEEFKVCESSIKSILLNLMLEYVPINIDCRKNTTVTKIINSLVIEKINNYYIVVLNGFMNRPIYLLDGENRYFEFDGDISEFIDKIETMICTMYSLTSSEFEDLSKLLVVDSDVIEENDKVQIISRKEMFDSIVQTNSNIIIDLLDTSCNVIFNDEENNTVKIICEGLGLNKYEETLGLVSNLLKKIGHENIIFTGLFLTNSIKDDILKLNERCNIDTLSKHASM